MCWYCENGVPDPVRKVFDELAEIDPSYEFGPGHIVFGDYNLNAESIQWCLDNMETYRRDLTDEQMEATAKAFRDLLAIPDDVRVPAAAREEFERDAL